MSRSIVSTTLAYTGGYIFLVLLAVCLATGAFSLFFCCFLSLKSRRASVSSSRVERFVCPFWISLSLSVARLESFSFLGFERYR